MLIFDLGIKLLILAIIIFFLVFSYLCYQWSAMHERRERIIIAVVVPLLYSFVIFFIGFIVIGLVSLALKYLPTFLKTL